MANGFPPPPKIHAESKNQLTWPFGLINNINESSEHYNYFKFSESINSPSSNL